MKKNNFLNLFIVLAFLFCACEKKDLPQPEQPPQDACASKIFVLCEGVWQMNNSTITAYDCTSGKTTGDVFLAANNRGLGDTGSDLQRYGSKMYCVVNMSETVEIMDLDAHSLRQLSLAAHQPRHIAFHQNNAYVCCYDGAIIKIDTATLEITGTGQAGSNPDGICVANGKLYVANSGGLNYPNYGHSVSVLDPTSLQVLKEIEIGTNPTRIQADPYGDVYVLCNGNYNDIAPTLQRIDSQNDELVQTFDFPLSNFTICNDLAYLYYYDYSTQQAQIKVLNVVTENIVKENFITDGTEIKTPYCIAANPANGDVYIADAYQYTTNGDVYCFSANGRKKFSFETGINPCGIVILPESISLCVHL